MKENNTLKGVFLVALGASSFGMLASFVKLAYASGYTTAEVTFSQVVLGLLGISLLNILRKRKMTDLKESKRDIRNLILAGTSMGFTSVLYYLSVSFINASIAVVLLMQSVWIGVVIESFMTKRLPSLTKILAVILILIGTVLATNLMSTEIQLDPRGLLFGFLASCSFATTMFTSNAIATHLPALRRSLYMLMGATSIVGLFTIFTQVGPNNSEFFMQLLQSITTNTEGVRDFDFSIIYEWGFLLALFGTIIPPILLNMGFPHTGVGLGSIIASIELPVSVSVAYLLLKEQVIAIQWFGILLILGAIVLMNSSLLLKNKSKSPNNQ